MLSLIALFIHKVGNYNWKWCNGGKGCCGTKDVPPYAIAGGNLVRIIKMRSSENTAKYLLNSEWWAWSEEKIRQMAEYIQMPKFFIEQITSKK